MTLDPVFAVVRRPVAPVSGELAKALIINTGTGAAFPVMYNPEELRLEQGNTFAEIAVPGLNAPPTQYLRGKARALTMELFFDSYETGSDVRAHTAPIVALLDKEPQTQAPPVLLFSLGRLQFRCVLVDAGQRFTMFLRDGTPVRSTMSVRLQEYVEIDVDLQQGFFVGGAAVAGFTSGPSPVATATGNEFATTLGPAGSTTVRTGGPAPGGVHVVVQGDTLSGLAGAYLGDPGLWRAIAIANRIDDPFDLRPASSLVIPAAGGAR